MEASCYVRHSESKFDKDIKYQCKKQVVNDVGKDGVREGETHCNIYESLFITGKVPIA